MMIALPSSCFISSAPSIETATAEVSSPALSLATKTMVGSSHDQIFVRRFQASGGTKLLALFVRRGTLRLLRVFRARDARSGQPDRDEENDQGDALKAEEPAHYRESTPGQRDFTGSLASVA
jgi:hypothetical protein